MSTDGNGSMLSSFYGKQNKSRVVRFASLECLCLSTTTCRTKVKNHAAKVDAEQDSIEGEEDPQGPLQRRPGGISEHKKLKKTVTNFSTETVFSNGQEIETVGNKEEKRITIRR